ncbi:MAG: hypothetical protein HC874_14100 [Richelia sp. SL_2_1]|nr:hypothetical protein [Richelia sp. SL_2_1]
MISTIKLRSLAQFIERKLGKLEKAGFILIAFETNKPEGKAKFICNCNRFDMIAALEDVVQRMK